MGREQAAAVGTLTKGPRASRVYFNYPGQNLGARYEGSGDDFLGLPSKTAKVMAYDEVTDTKSTALWQTERNDLGKVTRFVDPDGRELRFTYAANDIDLLSVEVRDGAAWQTLASLSNYTAHRPGTITDGAGLTTAITYNSVMQPETVTVSKGANSETTRFFYDLDLDGTLDEKGYLVEVEQTDPANASQFVTLATLTYDTAGRLHTETDTDGYTLTYSYDDLDRLTRITHPDWTTEQFVYEILDLVAAKDRGGLWTLADYNKIRQLVAVQDPAGRITQLQWCKCGSPTQLTDPEGSITRWEYDIQGRQTRKIYDDSTEERYAYHPFSGRPESVMLPNDVPFETPTVSFDYTLAGRMVSRDYTDPNTADVTFGYADPLGRRTLMVDGIGSTVYAYLPFDGSTDGAGNLATVDILSYAYDWQNRRDETDILNDALSASSWTESMTYDSLGRVASIDNLIGQFLPSYVGNGGRLANVAAPHGVTIDYEYYPVTEAGNKALRLKQIANKVNGAAVSTFDYDYDYDGRIDEWGQTLGTPKKTWNLGYDRASQLRSAVQTDASSTILERRSWQYDLAGNRTIENLGSETVPAQYNNLNQLTQTGGAGETLVEGTIDEPGSVTVNGQPAAMNNVAGTDDWRFQRKIPVVAGENTVTIAATDESNNTTTETYAFDVGPQDLVFAYDGNGNMLTDGVRTFTWDAQNRLTSVTIGTDIWEWEYDGLSRRVREWFNGALTKQWIWDGLRLIQQRDGTGAVTRNWQTGGSTQDVSGTQLAMVHTYDHLGSIREAIDSTGTVRARYDYELWGNRTKLAGDLNIEPGFTGHYEDAAVGLTSAPFRAYDAELGRWISRDPIGERGGLNLYGYALNSPIQSWDRRGFDANDAPGGGYSFTVRPGIDLDNLEGSQITNTNPNYSGQCATGAQFLTGTAVGNNIHDAPSTDTWRPGDAVGPATPIGTMVATGWEDGEYPNRDASDYEEGEVVNHTGIFMGMNQDGTMNLYDQFVGGALGLRIRDPEGYHTVISDEEYDPAVSDSAATARGQIVTNIQQRNLKLLSIIAVLLAQGSCATSWDAGSRCQILVAEHTLDSPTPALLVRFSSVSIREVPLPSALLCLSRSVNDSASVETHFAWAIPQLNRPNAERSSSYPDVSVVARNVTLESVLEQIADQTAWTFRVEDSGVYFEPPKTTEVARLTEPN